MNVHPKNSNGACLACRRGEDMDGEGWFLNRTYLIFYRGDRIKQRIRYIFAVLFS